MPQRQDSPASASRRDFLRIAGTLPLATGPVLAQAQPAAPPARVPGIEDADRVFITNEDSNTIAVINPATNRVETTINLTSFDEDPRPPFRYVTGGVAPTHAAMIHKPLYHGCIDAHGAVPSPDGRLLATSGRGSSNIYLTDAAQRHVIGNAPNFAAGSTTNRERISTGILVGREPHEPTFSRNGKELWVTVRGEDRIAVLDVEAAIRYLRGDASAQAIRMYVGTLPGPAQVWFNRENTVAFVASQKVSSVDVFELRMGADGFTLPQRRVTLDISGQDKPGFTPFLKTTPDGGEVWFSHKLADAVSCRSTRPEFGLLDAVPLGANARPNHVEFVENARGKVVYASLARVDDNGPGGVASSQIAIIDRSAPPGARKVVGTFFTHGRESHGLWTNPENTLLYVAHEQDELPGTPNAGQTVCSAFDVRDPMRPAFIAQIPLGSIALPSGELRNKKSINLVYVRVGARGQTG
ncbi:beta-propeller fold lactonase family protein [Ramlibacter alkalitolerans]|uniref:Beta-propeller fold lactonase family protein n=1 Tax=Ramlibacter alkalitolerans TaxID=2039631 RepID=A0ABS1JZA7_9BURK|nr:beta-propeller fold lactonase family protein [Ramlibacter alkalitolerans]MBL0428595.1 beta-propeller fold lactonase family protein [Ramlibacter alkalitolerans]